jgi:urea transport system permease protein
LRKSSLRLLTLLFWLTGAFAVVPRLASAQQPSLPEILQALPAADYADKQKLVVQLAATHAAEARTVISAMLDGRLYVHTADARLLVAAGAGDLTALIDPLTGQSAGSTDQEGLEKIGSNNQLRKALRGALAQFDLASTDVAVRLAAVKEMLGSLDEQTAPMLRQRLSQEPDAAVRTQINLGLALHDLDNADAAVRLTAVQALANSLNSDVFNRLATMVEKNGDGSYGEPDEQVRTTAAAALRSIKTRRSMYSGVETLFFGLSLGSVLVLSAIGLSITFGVMGVINMAHGELMMLGAYATYVVQQLMPNHIGASIVVAIPVAFMVSALAGVAIERGIVRFLYGRPLETLLATFGVSLVLQQVVRDVFSANNRPIETPAWLAGSLQINDVLSITYVRLYIVLFTLAVFVLLQLVLRRTRLGLEVRAVSQNRAMAKAMGIRTEWVDAMTFGLGSGIAGVAGVALSQLTNVGPNLGQSYIVDSFMVVVFGGVANLWGTLVGGLSLGVVSKMLEPFAGAVLAKIFVLIFLILFIQRRPRGLFPQKGRAAEH